MMDKMIIAIVIAGIGFTGVKVVADGVQDASEHVGKSVERTISNAVNTGAGR